ncbi:MAG: hypothetical protein AAF720_06555 [Pseudomonadota bacterium]
MSLAAICRALGIGILILAVAMVIPLAGALTRESEPAAPYLFSMALAVFASGLFIVVGSASREPRGDIREAMGFVFLWWLIAPVFGAAPFILSGAGVIDSYFEAVSALTTTGAWLSEVSARELGSGMLWRASMQWIGGLVSLSIASAIFVQPIFFGVETPTTTVGRPEHSSYFDTLIRAFIYFAPPYAALTGLCFGSLSLAGETPIHAAATALSLVASGGFYGGAVPVGEQGGYETSLLIAGVTLPFVFLSGISFALIAAAARGRLKRISDFETGAFALVVLTLGVILWILVGQNSGTSFLHQVFNAASLMSTNGVIIGDSPGLAIALIAVVIGGSAISTVGGLKILRWLVLFRRVRDEVRQLISPRAVFGRRFVSDEIGVWIHFLAFTFAIGALTLLLTAGGNSFELSVAAAAAILANAGPVLVLAEGGSEGYLVFEEIWLRLVLCLGMMLGRIETVAALVIFNRSFWRS